MTSTTLDVGAPASATIAGAARLHTISTLGTTRRCAAFDRRGFGRTRAAHEADFVDALD